MQRLADDNEDNAPFQNYFGESKPNSYSAYQLLSSAPCWLEKPSPLAASSKTLLSFT